MSPSTTRLGEQDAQADRFGVRDAGRRDGGPGGAEGFDRGGWAFKFERGPDGDAFKVDEVFGSDALLLGRRTYEGFAAAWPERTDEAGFADRMNSMAKYVVSGTLERADWNNTTVIGGDLATASAPSSPRTVATSWWRAAAGWWPAWWSTTWWTSTG